MRGHYKNTPPSVRDCQNVAKCSRLTTRKLLADGVAQGFLDIRTAPNDSRKRLVHPTPLAIAEYEAMVRRYVGLGETLIADKRRIKPRRA